MNKIKTNISADSTYYCTPAKTEKICPKNVGASVAMIHIK